MQIERRRNYRLRALFGEAYNRIEPLYASQPPRGLPVEWLVFRAAREAYPQLSPLELFQLTMSSSREYRSRHGGLPGRLAY